MVRSSSSSAPSAAWIIVVNFSKQRGREEGGAAKVLTSGHQIMINSLKSSRGKLFGKSDSYISSTEVAVFWKSKYWGSAFIAQVGTICSIFQTVLLGLGMVQAINCTEFICLIAIWDETICTKIRHISFAGTKSPKFVGKVWWKWLIGCLHY